MMEEHFEQLQPLAEEHGVELSEEQKRAARLAQRNAQNAQALERKRK